MARKNPNTWELTGFSMSGSLTVVPQYLCWVKVWALAGLLQKAVFFCFIFLFLSLKPSCDGFTLMLSVLVQLLLSLSHPVIILEHILVISVNNFLLNDGKWSRLRASPASPDHDASSTVLHHWD